MSRKKRKNKEPGGECYHAACDEVRSEWAAAKKRGERLVEYLLSPEVREGESHMLAAAAVRVVCEPGEDPIRTLSAALFLYDLDASKNQEFAEKVYHGLQEEVVRRGWRCINQEKQQVQR